MHPQARGRFAGIHGTYLDSASYGIPPSSTIRVMARALDSWATGSAVWSRDWDPAGDRSRALAAGVLGSSVDRVSLLPSVSIGTALGMSVLSGGDEVVISQDEFASLTLPVSAAARRAGASITAVKFEDLAASITPRTRVVALSHVRSNDGRVPDLPAIVEAAHLVGALVLLDATHSAGVLPVSADALGLDIVLAAGYKHLLCPRGVAFMAVGEGTLPLITPLTASWRGTKIPERRYFGAGLEDLEADARRLDISLAWLSWIGAEESLDFLSGIPEGERARWCTGLATQTAHELGLPASTSSILSIPVKDTARANAALLEDGIRASAWAGTVRASFHLYNSEADVERLVEAISPMVVNSSLDA